MKNSVYSFLIIITLILFTAACEQVEKNKSHQHISSASIRTGKKLALKYCVSCHELPDPSLADSRSWQTGILPQMGPRLGIFYYGDQQYPSYKRDLNVDPNYYPAMPVISMADWQHIIDYYTSTSPDSLLPAQRPVEIQLNNNLFQPIQPSFTYNMPSVSYTRIRQNELIMCDAFTKKILIFNKQLRLIDSTTTRGSVADIIEDSSSFILCNTGVLHPNNGKFGSVQAIKKNNKDSTKTLFNKLRRPVHITESDLNNDGKKDILVCEFGNLEGALSWLEKNDTGYLHHIIRNAPGVAKAYVEDYNHDGKPDVWALFAQGDESIYLFTNKGKGVFDAQRVLRFPPSYGSSYFEMADFNKDGFADIVYTCGDNADFSPVSKPYHGVYIFLNDGKNNFRQQYFYPINGSYKAIAQDFDNDGDLDLATISFYADYKNHP